MKNLIVLIILLGIVFSCKRKDSSKGQVVNKKNEMLRPSMDIFNWRKEILYIDSLKINDAIPIKCSKSELIDYFGLPNEVIETEYSNYFARYLSRKRVLNGYSLIYDNIVFDEIEGNILLQTINFNHDTDIVLSHPKIELSKHTNIGDLNRVFPESCKLTVVSGNTWSGHIILKVDDNNLDPRRWVLVFRSEQLVKITLYTFR